MRGSALALALVLGLAAPALADGQLVLESLPGGAHVTLDGWPMGRTPLVIHLLPGRHRLVAQLPGRARVAYVRVPNGLTLRRLIVLPARGAAPARPIQAPAARPATRVRPTRQAVHAHAHAPQAPVSPVRHAPPKPHAIARAPRTLVVLPSRPAHAPLSPAWGALGAWLIITLVALVARRRPVPQPPVWYPARPARGVLPGPAPGEAEENLRNWLADGEWALGAAGFWSLISERQGSSWHYYHLGLALHHAGRPYEAETAYRTALQCDPTCAPAAYNLGVLMMETGEPEQAVLAYRKLLDAHPLSVDGWFNLGHVYYQLRMPAQAREAWLEGRAIAPWDAALRQNLKMAPARPVAWRRVPATGSDPACA